MSDQKPDQPTTPDAGSSADPKKELAGKLATRPMTIFDQIFIVSMVLLVGVMFGIGPSLGLVMKGGERMVAYKVDATEVQRRERIAQALQEMLNPYHNPYGPLFTAVQVQAYGQARARPKSAEDYARDIRKAEYAAGRGLAPSKVTAQKLVDEFLARKAIQGERTYGQMIAEHRRAKDLSEADLALWFGEEYACQALDVASTAAPALPTAVAPSLKMYSDKASTDTVLLSAKPLLPEVKTDDPDFKATYDRLAALNRFTLPATTVVQVAAPDFDALLKAQAAPTNEQALIWYTGHLDEYAKPAAPVLAPANGQTPPPVQYHTFDEVKTAIIERLRRDAAIAKAQDLTKAFANSVEAEGLEQGDAAAFTRVAAKGELSVRDNVQVPDSADGKIDLPGYGPLKRTAREIGLAANKVGTITDQQQLSDGRWVVLRVAGRTLAANKPSEDPEVRSTVINDIACRRAYPLLLKEAEELRAQADKAGPGGLRKLFSDPAVKAKWNVEVVSSDMSLIQALEAPKVPEDSATTRGEPRLVASLAVTGNPVALCDGESEEALPSSVRLVQVTGLAASTPPTAEERGKMADGFRAWLADRLTAQAEESTRKKL